MVLRLKAWESRSPPGHRRAASLRRRAAPPPCRRAGVSPARRPCKCSGCVPGRLAPCRPRAVPSRVRPERDGASFTRSQPSDDAGWSSPVARQAHNLKVVGSNPTPATKKTPLFQWDSGVSLFWIADRLLNRKHTVSGRDALRGLAVTPRGTVAWSFDLRVWVFVPVPQHRGSGFSPTKDGYARWSADRHQLLKEQVQEIGVTIRLRPPVREGKIMPG